ncbi:MAG: type I 3-dehydroquinate dehydratase, partial [Pyrinomonadaceae bacterium]
MNNGRICVSVCADNADSFIENIYLAAPNADIIELRVDCLRPDQVSTMLERLSSVSEEKPFVLTFRSNRQGGRNTASFEERVAFWKKDREGIWAVDVEEDVLDASRHWPTRIVSFHDLKGTPDGLNAAFEQLLSAHTDVVKLAVKANDVTDGIHVWKLLHLAKGQNKNKEIIPIAMGEAGKWTRVLALAHGAFMTYAAINARQRTAEGQINADDLANIYRVKELDLETKVYGVIGNPVSASLSPYFLNPAFIDAGLNSVFIPFFVKDLGGFMNRMVRAETREVELNIHGLSVTMPHKQAIMKYLDEIDPTAAAIGAVNTVRIEDHKLIGYNTDAYGFIEPLRERYGSLSGKRLAVLGAGGAARACVYSLKQEQAVVTVFARDGAKADLFAREFGVGSSAMSGIRKSARDFNVIVNATPIGMDGVTADEYALSPGDLEGVDFVYDIVTSREETPLVQAAKAARIPTIGGIDMLV